MMERKSERPRAVIQIFSHGSKWGLNAEALTRRGQKEEKAEKWDVVAGCCGDAASEGSCAISLQLLGSRRGRTGELRRRGDCIEPLGKTDILY